MPYMAKKIRDRFNQSLIYNNIFFNRLICYVLSQPFNDGRYFDKVLVR